MEASSWNKYFVIILIIIIIIIIINGLYSR